jgi:glycosyltransferase involved in cell wall biosynthesis
MKLLYMANIRMPTEKAHGLQITQMCEAFAQAGADVTLLVSNRVNTPEMNAIKDIWDYYGVEHNFRIERVWGIDLFPLGKATELFAFYLHTLSFTIYLALTLLFRNADIYYSRDMPTLLVLSLFKPRAKLVYEAHQLLKSRFAMRFQSWCVRRVGLTVAVTGKLADDLTARGAKHIMVANDGFQIKRFANLPDQSAAREQVKLPKDAFIVGYVGRLHTMTLPKAVDKVIEAIATLRDHAISLCLVGGPDDMAENLRQHWLSLGLPADRFLYIGHVVPPLVPIYIAAFDVCAMPYPDTEYFRYYTSPLKLFEYLAGGRPILGTNLPSVAEVCRSEENSILVPPDDVPAMAAALSRLYSDSALRKKLGESAYETAQEYTWQGRAVKILEAIKQHG